MSISQRAVILIRLDARRAEGPVTVADLAEHMNLSVETVRLRIAELEAEGYVLPLRAAQTAYGRGEVVAAQLVGRLPRCD